MKILIATDMYKPQVNGVVTSVVNLQRGLGEMGHEVRVLTLSGNLHSHCEHGTEYLGSVGAGKIYPNARLAISPRLGRVVNELANWRPDVIHTQCEFSTFLAAKKIAALCAAPVVHTYHTLYEDYTHYFSPSEKFGKRASAFFSKKVLNSTDAVIAPTEKVREILSGYGVTTPVYTIPSGVDLAKFNLPPAACELRKIRLSLGISDTDMVLVFVGRLGREKNVDELLLLMKNSALNAKLLIVGDGPYRPSLEESASRLGIGHKVIFAGMAAPEDVAKYYRLGDVFISASRSETQGLTYLEAMASGRPLVCRRDKSLTGLVENGVNGFQYDTAGEFLTCVNQLLDDCEARKTMGANAMSAVSDYSVGTFAEKVMDVYKSILAHQCRKLAA